ncbi:MAG: hypothetical protein OER93_03590 [Thermoleophilia bacterium]|nr:hypothetical protein [Thermoleophilia bacterium]
MRDDVITITAARHELTSIVAAARMAHELISADLEAPAGAAAQLARALREYDSAIAHAVAGHRGSTPVALEQEEAMNPRRHHPLKGR